MKTYIVYLRVGYLGKKADTTNPIPKNQRVFPTIFPTFKVNIQVILGKKEQRVTLKSLYIHVY
jgi:hypothetical protein